MAKYSVMYRPCDGNLLWITVEANSKTEANDKATKDLGKVFDLSHREVVCSAFTKKVED